MLIKETVEVKITKRNIEHYINHGYKNISKLDIITVKNDELTKGSEVLVTVKCDYCGKNTIRTYESYFRRRGAIKKDSCSDCTPLKSKEQSLFLKGTENPAWSKDSREKRVATNMDRYGSSTPLGNKEVWDKIKETTQLKYGVNHIGESLEIKEKAKLTNIEKYGFENVFQNEEIKEKMKATNLQNYGFEYITQNKEEMNKRFLKSIETMNSNQTAPTSMQQTYIHNTLGGELNYPVDRLMLDIAFPEEMIYLEYQGSGHDLSVKLDKISEGEFRRKELSRYYYLKNLGWRMIEVVSPKDILPKENQLIEIFNLAKIHLKETSYVGFFLENNKIKLNGNYIDYKFNLELNYYHLKKHLKLSTETKE